MRRSLLMSGDGPYSRIFDDGSSAIHVPVGPDIVRDFVIELSLLYFGLAKRLSIRSIKGPELLLQASVHEFGDVKLNSQPVEAGLARRQLENMLVFLLRYERDGAAEVAHLDIEVGDNNDFTLVLVASHFTERMAGEEANRLLGIEEGPLGDFS